MCVMAARVKQTSNKESYLDPRRNVDVHSLTFDLAEERLWWFKNRNVNDER